ncbi:unnamed protein product [Durusdinium trenchii]|uniref:Uncharacterized protein n=1 Tax=Durusdinium trenchii TaxID=1381693 RepID=A0ABP0SXK2_9DINO
MTWREKVKTMTASQKGALIDALTGALVIANTVVIGLSADDVGWVGDQWHWLDCGLVFFAAWHLKVPSEKHLHECLVTLLYNYFL